MRHCCRSIQWVDHQRTVMTHYRGIPLWLATKKVIAEGTPTKKLVILGWQIDTRRMLIQLPAKKADAWDEELQAILELGDVGWPVGAKRLETMQGRNINVVTMIPGAMHHRRHHFQVKHGMEMMGIISPQLQTGGRHFPHAVHKARTTPHPRSICAARP